MNLELWFEQFLSNLEGVPSVTLTAGIDPIPIAEGSYCDKPNPHAWMGLDNALIYIDSIVAAFAKHDPDNAAVYQANAARDKERLRATIQPLRERIAKIPEDQRWLVTREGAFSYLARALAQNGQVILLVSTHNLGSVPEFCDRRSWSSAPFWRTDRPRIPSRAKTWKKPSTVFCAT